MRTPFGKLTGSICLMLGTVLGLGNGAWAQTPAPLPATGSTTAATAPPAPAAQPSKGERQAEVWFNMLDSNRDNHLSWGEVKHISPLAKDFKAADTDGNGLVSREEIRVLSRKRVAERRARKAQETAAKAAAAAASSAP